MRLCVSEAPKRRLGGVASGRRPAGGCRWCTACAAASCVAVCRSRGTCCAVLRVCVVLRVCAWVRRPPAAISCQLEGTARTCSCTCRFHGDQAGSPSARRRANRRTPDPWRRSCWGSEELDVKASGHVASLRRRRRRLPASAATTTAAAALLAPSGTAPRPPAPLLPLT